VRLLDTDILYGAATALRPPTFVLSSWDGLLVTGK
jgi:hypothetical protein